MLLIFYRNTQPNLRNFDRHEYHTNILFLDVGSIPPFLFSLFYFYLFIFIPYLLLFLSVHHHPHGSLIFLGPDVSAAHSLRLAVPRRPALDPKLLLHRSLTSFFNRLASGRHLPSPGMAQPPTTQMLVRRQSKEQVDSDPREAPEHFEAKNRLALL